MKQCIRFQGEMISRNMRDAIRSSGLDIVSRLLRCLMRECIHQIEINIIKILLSDFDCAMRLAVVVYSSQRSKMLGIKALNTDGKAVNSCGAEIGELDRLKCSGISLQRHFGEMFQRQQSSHGGENGIYGSCTKEAWGAAAEKYANYPAAPHLR